MSTPGVPKGKGRGRAVRRVDPNQHREPGQSQSQAQGRAPGQGHGQSQGQPGRSLQAQNQSTQPSPSRQVTRGRPAGMSSGSDNSDDDFEFGSSFSKPHTQRPLTAPSTVKSGGKPNRTSATSSGAGTYYFTPSTMGSLDSRSSAAIASSSGVNWGHGHLRSDTATTDASSVSSRATTTAVGNRAPRGRDAFPTIPMLDSSVTSTMASINKSWNNGFPVNRDSCLAYITVALRAIFQTCPNPYTAGLHFMGFSGDFFTCKPGTLSLHVMTELKKWLLDQGLTEFERTHLTPEIQMIAFDISTRQKNVQILKLVCEVYRLDKIKNQLVEVMRGICTKGHYKEAAHIATFLGMYTHFDIHDFVVPLLLQDREFVVEEYLTGSKEKQTDLLGFLDGMLDEKRNSIQAMREYAQSREINQIKLEKMQAKPLVKLVTRLIDKFKADPVHCPNFSRKKRSAALRHLVHRKYDDPTPLNDACFEELVDSTVLSDPILQDEIIYHMRVNNDLKLAAKFALRHALPLARVPSDVQGTMHKLNPNVIPLEPEVAEEEEDWETELNPSQAQAQAEPKPKPSALKTVPNSSKSVTIVSEQTPNEIRQEVEEVIVPFEPKPHPDFHFVCVPKHNVHHMDSPFGVESFLKDLKGAFTSQRMNGGREDFIIVSVDAEWKPIVFERTGVALIQIGLGEDVYLIDITKLKVCKQEHRRMFPFWEELRDQFFANEHVVKMGYGLDGDIRMFANTCPQWENVRESYKNFLDIGKVHRELVKLNENFFPYSKSGNPNNNSVGGLSELVRAAFGKPLDKDNQFSNWEKRPLRAQQIHYATADAYILLELFAFMSKRSAELNIDLEGIILTLLNSPKPTALPKKKKSNTAVVVSTVAKAPRVVPVDSPYVTTQLATDVKFICDNMVQGLGKQLRSCGIDTLILDNDEEHDRCVHYAARDGRAIITRGGIYNHLSSGFPEFTFFNVTVDKLEEQLQDVLSYFNISVCEADLFSRCQKCNSGKFISISKKTMEYLLLNRNRVLRQSNVTDQSEVDLVGEISYPVENGQIIKKWTLLPENVINVSDLKNIRTQEGASIIFDKITPGHLEHINTFIVCDKCGKIYWDGSHLKRVKQGNSILPVPASAPRQTSPNPNPRGTSAGPGPSRRSAPSNSTDRPRMADLSPRSSTGMGFPMTRSGYPQGPPRTFEDYYPNPLHIPPSVNANFSQYNRQRDRRDDAPRRPRTSGGGRHDWVD